MNVLAFAPDLADQSKIRNALGRDVTLQFVREIQLTDNVDLLLVDLNHVTDPQAVLSIERPRCIAFGSHVALGALEKQRPDTSSVELVPRSQFFAKMRSLALGEA